MPRYNRKPNPKGRPTRQPPLEAAAPVNFGPLMPFLHKRLGEDHPICAAARTSDLSAFMAAIRASGDTQVEHEIADELLKRPLHKVPAEGRALELQDS
jgi:hypothetical protein